MKSEKWEVKSRKWKAKSRKPFRSFSLSAFHFSLFTFHFSLFTFHFSLFTFCLLFSACGKIGDALPPIPRAPLTINDLAVTQQGARLTLSFPIVRPPRAQRLQRVDIYRLIEPESAPLGMTVEDFSTRASLIHSIPGEQIPVNTSTVTYPEELDITQQPGGLRYRYAVRLVNQDGQAAAFSNYAYITPLTNLAAPPAAFQTKQTQTQIEITWTPSAANENGARPANVAGYNLYRRNAPDGAFVRLNAQPLRETRYVDRAFAFGATYEYIVRPLSFLPGSANLATAIEGNASAPLSYTPKDTFAPVAPSSITIASANATVSLFWPSNAEADLAGYNIYRADDEKAPPAQWIKLNARLHTPTTYTDRLVQVGKQYFYQITVVDTAGNESARSEVQSETVNP